MRKHQEGKVCRLNSFIYLFFCGKNTKKYGINRFIITFVDKSCSYGCFISYKVSHN